MTLLEVLKESLGNPVGWEGRPNNKSVHTEVEYLHTKLYIALRASAEMVPNPDWVFDLIGPQEVWSPRSLVPKKFWPRVIWPQKFWPSGLERLSMIFVVQLRLVHGQISWEGWEPNKIRVEMRSGTISATADLSTYSMFHRAML